MKSRWLVVLLSFFLAMVVSGCGSISQASAGKVQVVGAEGFYADLLGQIGGNRVQVTSILNDPNADPHAYEPTATDARAVEPASIVVLNGLGYDAWMERLLSSSNSSSRHVIVVGDLAQVKLGSNPHVWYDVGVMKVAANAILRSLVQVDPTDRSYFKRRAAAFRASLAPVTAKIRAIRAEYGGRSVAQTEPVFAYMLRAVNLRADEGPFQHAIEAGNDPPPSSIAAIENSLSQHRVTAFVYNLQATQPITVHLSQLAKSSGIPVVGVYESEPPSMSYARWMLSELTALQSALRKGPS